METQTCFSCALQTLMLLQKQERNQEMLMIVVHVKDTEHLSNQTCSESFCTDTVLSVNVLADFEMGCYSLLLQTLGV